MKNIITLKIEDSIVDYFYNLQIPTKTVKNTATVNGNQTPNIVNLINPQLITHLKSKYLFPTINQMKGGYNIRDLEIDHIHHIKYKPQGIQRVHTHEFFEDYSFILYLNNCNDGHTIIYDFPKPHILTPKRGEITIFKSYLFHEGLETNSSKEIIVGSIREINKEWIPRN